MADASEQSKSAKRRAAKKVRDESYAEAPAPEPEPKAKAKAKAKAEAKATSAPAPEPKAKAKAKAQASPPELEPKAKAKGKAKAAAAPEPVKEAPKAKAKAKAAAEPKASAAPEAKPKAQPKQKAAAKQAAKPAAAKEEQEVKREELIQPFEIDDGAGDGWEQSTGLTKKAQKKQEKVSQAEAEAKTAAKGKPVPGMAPTNSIPGMATSTVQKTSQAEINAVLQRAAAAGAAARANVEAEQAKDSGIHLHTATVQVPDNRIGVVIGPKGKNIQLIQEKTGVQRIDTSGEVFTISGTEQAVAEAEAAVKELIEKGYWSRSFEDFKEEFVSVLPSSYPDLIGKGGAIIKAMKTEFGVEVNIPETPKNPPAGKKYKVTLAGKKENVEACKEAINNICMYGYDVSTHPGFTHELLDVPDWAYRFLIGKAGSEMRHIQNNYKVKVNIPREHSACQSVVVVGEKINVERAKLYVEKLMWNAENQSKGRDKSDGTTDTGAEEEEEAWMNPYMYKRK